MKRLLIALSIVLLVGCASHGTRFQMDDVRAMKPGVTTYEEAVAKLGKPKSTIYNNDGSIQVMWLYANAYKGQTARVLFYQGRMVRVISISE